MNQSREARAHAGTPAGAIPMRTSSFFGLLPAQFIRRKKEFFTYNLRFNTIAAGGTQVQTANVQNDSDFVWVQGAVTVTNAAFTTFTAASSIPMLATLSDAASGMLMQDSATHISNLFGTVQLPFTLPFPKVFRKGGQISLQLQNQDGANAFVVNVSFHGFKVYFIPESE